ncbi:MAG: hypothetical protein KTR24_05110 [Saprospiraceae bacterium]|nr:hypothetical protein [Saprospiraceae bacterium]
MKTFAHLLILCLVTGWVGAQQFSDNETLRIDLDGIEHVGLYNHRGNVKVIGSNSNQAVVTYKRTLRSASSRKLEEAKEEIKFLSERDGNRLLLFMEAPDLKFQISPDGRGHYRSPNWNEWNDRYQVDFEFEIVLEIPAQMNLDVSNHHSALEVSGVRGTLHASNHHKDLLIEGAGSMVKAHSHHGDVTVTHASNPTKESDYQTHHGDIRVSYRSGLGAEAKMHTHHGSLYSDFDWTASPQKVSSSKSKRGTKYKIGKDTVVKIGSGGPTLNFDTHHGHIYLVRI